MCWLWVELNTRYKLYSRRNRTLFGAFAPYTEEWDRVVKLMSLNYTFEVIRRHVPRLSESLLAQYDSQLRGDPNFRSRDCLRHLEHNGKDWCKIVRLLAHGMPPVEISRKIKVARLDVLELYKPFLLEEAGIVDWPKKRTNRRRPSRRSFGPISPEWPAVVDMLNKGMTKSHIVRRFEAVTFASLKQYEIQLLREAGISAWPRKQRAKDRFNPQSDQWPKVVRMLSQGKTKFMIKRDLQLDSGAILDFYKEQLLKEARITEWPKRLE